MSTDEFLLNKGVNYNLIDMKNVKATDGKNLMLFPYNRLMDQITTRSFEPSNCKPNDWIRLKYSFEGETQRYIENDHYLQFTVTNSHATDTLTVFNDALSFINKMRLTINDSNDNNILQYNDSEYLKFVRSEKLRSYGEDELYHNREKELYDSQPRGFNGVTIAANGGTQTFYLNLFTFFPQLKHLVFSDKITSKEQGLKNKIYRLYWEIQFHPSYATAEDVTLNVGQSSSINNIYTSTNIAFSDITYVRLHTSILQDNRITRPKLSKQYIHMPIFHYDKLVVDWNTLGNFKDIKISDMTNIDNVQFITAFITDNNTAFNSANASKRYNTENYITWSIAEQDGAKQSLVYNNNTNMPDNVQRLRSYTMDMQDKKYQKKLPYEIHDNSTDMNKYLIHTMTTISLFNLQRSSDTHIILPYFNPKKETLTVRYTCSGTISASCTLHVLIGGIELYNFMNHNLVKESFEDFITNDIKK